MDETFVGGATPGKRGRAAEGQVVVRIVSEEKCLGTIVGGEFDDVFPEVETVGRRQGDTEFTNQAMELKEEWKIASNISTSLVSGWYSLYALPGEL